MPAEVINLRRARKARLRSEKERTAAENRRRHGRTKAEKAVEDSAEARAATQLEGHRRERADDKP